MPTNFTGTESSASILSTPPLPQEPRLVDGCGPKGVPGGQQRAAAFAPEQVGQLPNRRRLARAIDAHHEHDPRRAVEVERARPPFHFSDEVGLEIAKRVSRRAQVRPGRLPAQVLDDPLRGGYAGVGGDQRRFEVVAARGIEGGAAKDLLDVGDVALTTRLERFRKAFPESLALSGRRVLWIRRSVHRRGPKRPGAAGPTPCARSRARRGSRRRVPRPAPSWSGCG